MRDDEREGFDLRTDFASFIEEQGNRFENAVLKLLSDSYPQWSQVQVGHTDGYIREAECALATFEAMSEGVEFIHRGVLWDPQHKTYGGPDLLVRSDVMAELFSTSIAQGRARTPGLVFKHEAHYVVVDVKFSHPNRLRVPRPPTTYRPRTTRPRQPPTTTSRPKLTHGSNRRAR